MGRKDYGSEHGMKVILIRHGKVDYRWKKWSTSGQFDLDCIKYDQAHTEPVRTEIPEVIYQRSTYGKIYISSLPRTGETAARMFGDNEFTQTGLIDEVPLRSSLEGNVKLPLWFWNISGRLQWLFNRPRQPEGRRDTKKRAKKFVKTLLENGENCIIVTHGFFMHTLIDSLKESGFRIGPAKMTYANGEYVVAERCVGKGLYG